MEKNPSTSSSKSQETPITPQITPELLQAMTEQFFALQKANVHTPQPEAQIHTFGSIKLKSINPQMSFKAKTQLTPRQQILVDYAWNARNKPQMTMALHVLCAHFSEENIIKKALPKEAIEERALEPSVPTSKLISAMKEMEVENTLLQQEVSRLRNLEKDLNQMKEYINNEEQNRKERWGAWIEITAYISPVREEILKITYADAMGEHLFYQQMLRKLACQKQLFRGLTFICETYTDEDAHVRGFSYITCSINLKYWKDINLNGETVTLGGLIKYGLLRRLVVTERIQLRQLTGLEKLRLVLAALYEEQPKAAFECEFQSIPPSYEPRHLDDARNYITVQEVACAGQCYFEIPQEKMVSEDKVDLLDQINSYRAMVYRKPYLILPGIKLLTEDKHNKVYGPWRFNNMFIRTSFSGQTISNPEEVVYFSKIKAYQMTVLLDVVTGPYIGDGNSEEEVGSARLSDALDDIGIQNLNNTMET